MLDTIQQDVRFAIRALRRRPLFSGAAAMTLGLGVGATTAMFSVADAVLLEPLPFPRPDRLMRPSLLLPARPDLPPAHHEVVWSFPKYEVFKSSQGAFSATAIYSWFGPTLTGNPEPQRISVERIESPYLEILGVRPLMGRGFTAQEDELGADRAILLGHGLWLGRWGGDASILGQSVTVSGIPYTVVGILPPGFKGLSGRAEAFVPFSTMSEANRRGAFSHSYFMVARLKDGVTPAQARADMEAVGRRIDEAFPTTDASLQGWSVTARSLNELRADPQLRTSILLLLGAVAFVLLIACANLANLLLVRAMGRRREIAIRASVGCGRGRLVRQLLAESFVLAAGGGAVGLALAFMGVDAIRALSPATWGVVQGDVRSLTLLGLDRIAVSGTVFLFTLVIALATGVLFGLAPAIQVSRTDLNRVLREGGDGPVPAKRFGVLGRRKVLVVAEFTMAFVLLAGSGLMLKSFARLNAVDTGFRSEGVLTAHLALSSRAYDPWERETFFSELLERIGSLPGVQSVAVSDCPPVSGGCSSTVIRFFDRPEVEEGTEPSVNIHTPGPGFFETMAVPLIRGRTFDDRDGVVGPRVAILSERAANEFWPGEDPIGRRVGLGQEGFWDGAEVVGIVGDVHYETIESRPDPTAYVPFSQVNRSRGFLFVRAREDPAALAASLRQVVASLDPDVAVTDIRTMDQRVAAATIRTRVSAGLLSLFAAVALALSATGIFGVLSYLVAQQTREISIRMALGARRGRVFADVLRQAGQMMAIGVALGVLASLGLMSLLKSLLFEVRPEDPTTFGSIALILTLVAMAAAYLPAWRATRVEPVEALNR